MPADDIFGRLVMSVQQRLDGIKGISEVRVKLYEMPEYMRKFSLMKIIYYQLYICYSVVEENYNFQHQLPAVIDDEWIEQIIARSVLAVSESIKISNNSGAKADGIH